MEGRDIMVRDGGMARGVTRTCGQRVWMSLSQDENRRGIYVGELGAGMWLMWFTENG